MDLVIYTDGACSKNGQCGAIGGLGVYCEDRVQLSIPISGSRVTNNICELEAIKFALVWLYEQSCFSDIRSAEICTDSVYSMNCVTRWIQSWKQNNWMTAGRKPVKNKELIVEIDHLIQRLEGIDVAFRYVSNNNHRVPPEDCEDKDWVGNYKADKLATNATNGQA